ncbi:MAG: 3-dehydroquinate synthase family protein [Planctomycetota bacterium]
MSVANHWRYVVHCAPGLLGSFGSTLRAVLGERALVVLTDATVYELHGRELQRSCADVALPVQWVVIPPGETSKSLAMFAKVLDRLAELGFDRRSVLINFGGGVICDLGGFVAASYMRGVDYVNFSTTLIGQLDASLGGKVAVNSASAKNLIGAFHHPRHVGADPEVLRTLSSRDLKSGIAEAIKIAIISSPTLFELLQAQQDRIVSRCAHTLAAVVGLAARLKMDLVARDPCEADLRRPLNLGHTLGHPIESVVGYGVIKHGEAVAVGTTLATLISLERKLIARREAERIFDLMHAYGLLGCATPVPVRQVLEKLRYVRMIRGNHLFFVLPRAVGDVVVDDTVTDAEIERAFAARVDLVARGRA